MYYLRSQQDDHPLVLATARQLHHQASVRHNTQYAMSGSMSRVFSHSSFFCMSSEIEPTAVVFRRLLDDDVRAMSVIEVQTLDDLRSSAMGGVSQCSTCGRAGAECGGHFGHIELPIEVQHPLFAGTKCSVVPVPPTRIRFPNREHDAPLTSLLRRIIAAVQRYKRALDRNTKDTLQSATSAIQLAVNAYYLNSGADGSAGLCERLRGKHGLLRQQLMGWRVNSCARAVIVPDPLLAPWEVGVPGRVADKLQLRSGDRVVMNRQPSLHRGSMMGHVVRVRPHDYCFSLSPTVTPPYNADFDGDEMNMHITSHESRADAIYTIGVEHTLLSAANGSASVRLVQDACLARYLKTGDSIVQQRAATVHACERYGQVRAAQLLQQHQLDAHQFMSRRGFSIGLDDFLCRVPHEGRSVYTLGTVAQTVEGKLPATNRILQVVKSGSKGSSVNLAQLFSCVGMQTVQGKPACPPPFCKDADAFVSHSFTEGLTESEFWMHACAAREGMVQTAIKTADSGYLMRRMVKCFENISVSYDDTVRTTSGQVVQFRYGGDGVDTTTAKYSKPRPVEPGTPVGILCAQSIGEKLTQLTLDTFHKAGIAFQHGLLRVKTIIDASKNNAVLMRGLPRPHASLRYCLDDVVDTWTRIQAPSQRALAEAYLRKYDGARLRWRTKPHHHVAWQVAARVREQYKCECVSDETYVYANCKPQGSEPYGSKWAGAQLVDGAVPVQQVVSPFDHVSYYSEPPIAAAHLGIEAARAVLIQELAPSMAGVDRRHLELLADAMTYTGTLLGATRTGMRLADSSAVLGHACFETATGVLTDAAQNCTKDPLSSASSRLATGLLPKLGAHMVDIISPVQENIASSSLLDMPVAKRARFGEYM